MTRRTHRRVRVLYPVHETAGTGGILSHSRKNRGDINSLFGLPLRADGTAHDTQKTLRIGSHLRGRAYFEAQGLLRHVSPGL